MNRLRKALPWLALALVAGLIWSFWPSRTGKSDEAIHEPSFRRASGNLPASAEAGGAGRQSQSDHLDSVARLIQSSLAKFRASSDAEESKRILAGLRDGIRTADPQVAAQAVISFLRSGVDAPTHLPFSVGNEGMMDGVPSLRLALLDLLPSLDPELALEFSRAVMDQKSNPDEYALALRNLAWSDLNGDMHQELMDRLNQMIQVVDWASKPSAGFLEALDAAVFVSDNQSFEILESLHQAAEQSGDVGLKRATFIALDRVVLRNPESLVRAFENQAGLSEMTPSLRASLMSRLDIANDTQRGIFTRYLADPSLGDQELNYFAGIFPNGNYIHGNWLMSGVDGSQSIDQRRQSDAQVLVELDRLRNSGGSDRVIQLIVRIQDRLKRLSASPANQ